MKILILGGTQFIGIHLVAAARARGHEVTVFNRGTTPLVDADGIEQITGDRHRDLDRLAGRRWDAVVDTCGYVPSSLESSTAALADAVDRYVFISSISVYADFSTHGMDETAPLATLSAESLEKAEAVDRSGRVTGSEYGGAYGALKVRCEDVVRSAFPERALVVRPGLVAGSHDPTERFTYWVVRVARGGEILAPGRPERLIQYIDAADLADWTIQSAERRATGIYNVTGPATDLTMAAFLEECRQVAAGDATFTWVPDAFLRQHEVKSWTEMPLWIPETETGHSGLMHIDCRKAFASGLRPRPVRRTIEDVLAWANGPGADRKRKNGLAEDRELELLRAWRG
ncbi:MAG: NAD-dependent epimerase/dehydratase family protein [Gemmatimonadetes bacterium]|nr:NAD-dependent epimerase/dehydratase family protein [Gemmatimonadota bacterium]